MWIFECSSAPSLLQVYPAESDSRLESSSNLNGPLSRLFVIFDGQATNIYEMDAENCA